MTLPNPIASRRFRRFLVVGTVGFLCDAAVSLLLIRTAGLPPIPARVLAFIAASVVTYRLNRRWTFETAPGADRGWRAYVAATGVGSLLNLAAYTAWIGAFGAAPAAILTGVAMGSLVGLSFNYFASARFIFGRGSRT